MDLSPSSFTHFLQNQGLERKKEQFVQLNPFSQWILHEIHLLLKGSGHCLYTRVSQELPASKKTSSRCYSVRSRQTSWEEFEREEQKRSGPRGIDLLRKIKRAKYVTETRDTTKKGGEEEWDMTTVCKYLKAVNTKEGEELFRVLRGRGRRSNGMDLIRVFSQEPVEGKGEKPPQ